MTRNGIERNLEISPFVVNCGNYKFYFSSMNYKEKFEEEIETFRQFHGKQMFSRIGIKMVGEFYLLSFIKLYEIIEKRGFLISVGGEKIKCKNKLILIGEIKIRKS